MFEVIEDDGAVKICHDCKHFLANREDAKESNVECNAEGNQQRDYITGAIKVFYMTAQAMRIDSKYCGHSAAWFEPK